MQTPVPFQFKYWGLALVSVCLVAGTRSALAHGDAHERIEVLSQALDEHPDWAELWLQRADLRRLHGELSAALVDANEALRLRPSWPPALLQRARVLLARQQYGSANAAADACLERAPDNSDARVVLARCHAALGDTNAAIDALNVVLSGKATPLPDLYLERARWQAGLGDVRGAVQGLDAGMQRLGQTPSLALPALAYERQAGDFEAALDRLETLQRYIPYETYLAMKGEVLMEAGQVSEAKEVFGEALSRLTNSVSLSSRETPQEVERLKARFLAGLESATEASVRAAAESSLSP